MPFFTRPELDDRQFKQLTGSTLTMIGTTNFDGTITSKGVEINALVTGGSAQIGNVLTLVDGNRIVLREGGASGDTTFDSTRTTTRVGIPNVNVGEDSVNGFLEGYFFPSVAPGANISINSGGNNREFGDDTLGNLSWIATRNTYPILKIELDDNGDTIYNNDITIIDGNTQVGITSYSLDSNKYYPPAGAMNEEMNFKIKVTDDDNVFTVSNSNISWKHKRYWFDESTYYDQNDPADLLSINSKLVSLGGGNSELSTTIEKILTYEFNNEYFYYATPIQFGEPKFKVNGLTNNAWGDRPSGTLFTMTFTKSNGYPEEYNISRSNYKLTGSYDIIITN